MWRHDHVHKKQVGTSRLHKLTESLGLFPPAETKLMVERSKAIEAQVIVPYYWSSFFS